ncbi:helix-turn-helix transcriptional regulator [Janibacter massiliensis]|uniref:helix-turn-helix transcriptional regulator n=1 Tax=Janibacter massiliensis TaxID=2058291 RepID=UPI000D10D070|nr:metalloregulator ArsR/SmtB family transcription factor [Janibacter massiliensis]
MTTPETARTEGGTRARVLEVVTRSGPVTAVGVAEELGLTPAGVRRHLEALVADGTIEVREEQHSGGRGRPAKAFVVSDEGHGVLQSAYDDIAVDAVRFIAELGGSDAVARFARERTARLEARYARELADVGDDPQERTQALVGALRRDGFAASTRPVGDHPGAGLQLCQGHCPVHEVAGEFPVLCDAETETFSRLIGVHVQRLATLAHGDHVCTTHVPATASGTTRTSSTTSPTEGRTR